MFRTEEERMRAQLAFAGWLPAEDLAEVTTDDEYTPPELVDKIEEFLGGTIDLDTCWDPRCFVKPRVGYTKSEDGLAPKNSWLFDKEGKRFWNRWVQPPYSSQRRWLERLVELHAETDIEVGTSLALIKCDPSTRAWKSAWKADAILFFAKRIPHVQPGRATRNVAPFPQAMLYFGPHVKAFEAWAAELGVVRLRPLPEPDAPVAREHELVAIDGIPAESYPFLPTAEKCPAVFAQDDAQRCQLGKGHKGCHRTDGDKIGWWDSPANGFLPEACEKHNASDCRVCADAITVVDEPVIEVSPIAENPQAWPVVEKRVCIGCGAHFDSKAAQDNHRCLAGGAR